MTRSTRPRMRGLHAATAIRGMDGVGAGASPVSAAIRRAGELR